MSKYTNTFAVDLFGNERPAPQKAGSAPVQLSAFDHAAERKAIDSGRPVSQERTELVAPSPVRTEAFTEPARTFAAGDRIRVKGAGKYALGTVSRMVADSHVLYRCDYNKSERLAPLAKVSLAKAGRA